MATLAGEYWRGFRDGWKKGLEDALQIIRLVMSGKEAGEIERLLGMA